MRPHAALGRSGVGAMWPGRLAGIACVLGMLGLPGAAAAGTFTAFGPQNYLRDTGEPVTVITNFSILDPAAAYTIQIHNGGLEDGEFELVAHSVIKINGMDLVSASEFNESVSYLEKPIPLNSNNALSVELHGQPGGGITVLIVGVDNVPPTITAGAAPQPNAAGWNRTDVTVTFTCEDATSGIASCPAPVTVGAEGEGQVVTGTATDRAGNTATGEQGCGASGDRGAREGILLNGITPGVSPVRLPQHPRDHANKRARQHHWRTGLGPRMAPLPILCAHQCTHTSFFPRRRDAIAYPC